MKTIINFIILILLTSLTYAITIGNPLPTITTTFNEPVILSSIDATLTDTQTNPIQIENTFISLDNKTIKYRPITYLSEGNYVFSIKAQDIYGNLGELQTQSFTINVPPTSIYLISPSFGVSSTEIADITIETSLPSQCRHSLFSDTLYENMAGLFEITDNILHTHASLSISNLLPPTHNIYIACFTDYDNSINTEQFTLSVDSTIPIITDISINQITQQPIETTIELTTDDLTVCKYSKENILFPEMSFFISLNESISSTYSTIHSQPLIYPEIEDYTINTFYIICKNLAGLLSETKIITIEVDTTADATITINHPQSGKYYSNPTTILNITTNKLAVCYFSNNSENIFGGGGTFGGSTGMYNHLSNPLYLTHGNYEYFFRCFIDPPDGPLPVEYVSFIIDTTPPLILYVDDSNTVPGMQNFTEFTYYTDKLDLKWDAIDNESGIGAYEYSVYKDNGYAPDELIKDWASVEEEGDEDQEECNDVCNDINSECNNVCGDVLDECDDSCSYNEGECKNTCEGEDDETGCKNTCEVYEGECNVGCIDIKDNCNIGCNTDRTGCFDNCSSNNKQVRYLDLEDQTRYYFKLKAKNGAGSWSQESLSNGITVDLSLLLMGTCNNGAQDFNETDIDCGDLCNKCTLNQSCNINEDCLSNYCNLFNSSKRCSVFIDEPTCVDGIKNQDETDLDCGGSCPGCTTTKSCSINSDCLSDHCDPEIRRCVIPDTCSNNLLEVDETDIDCGGNCLSCENSKVCILDSDCLSNHCNEKTKTCSKFTLCGNGIIDSGEQCENSTDGRTCSLFRFGGGSLTCGEDCLFNTTLCIGNNGTCGDDIINPGEQCEGPNWGKVDGCFDFDKFESGELDCQECILNTNKCSKEVDPTQDTDRDGMSDVCELKYFKHRTSAKPNDDPDEDGLTNKEECKLCGGEGTNPKEKDTDGDGYADNKEIKKGTSPCNSEEYPKSSFLLIAFLIIIIVSVFGGGGYYIYSKRFFSFSSKSPYVKLNANISFIKEPPFIVIKSTLPPPLTPPALKRPGIIEFIKTPPYVKLNANISFIKEPPFIVIKSTLPPPQIQQPQQIQMSQARPIIGAPLRRMPTIRRQVAPRRNAPPVGLVLKKRKRRKVLDTFKTEKKDEDKDKKEG